MKNTPNLKVKKTLTNKWRILSAQCVLVVCLCVYVCVLLWRWLGNWMVQMACCIVLTRWYILRLWMINTIVFILATSLYYPPILICLMNTPNTAKTKTSRDLLFRHKLCLGWQMQPAHFKTFSPSTLPTILSNSDTKRLWLTILKQFSGKNKYS